MIPVHFPNANGNTPLHIAVYCGKRDVFNYYKLAMIPKSKSWMGRAFSDRELTLSSSPEAACGLAVLEITGKHGDTLL